MADLSHMHLMDGAPDHGRHPLQDWELAFCKWAAAHPHARAKDQEKFASDMAGTTITWVELRNLRGRKAFRNWYHRYRAKIAQRMDQHRETFETENIETALLTHKWAMEQAKKEGDHRAVAPLVEPAIRVLYKQTLEEREKPMIVVNLGPSVQARMTEPIADVEWEALPPGEPRADDPN